MDYYTLNDVIDDLTKLIGDGKDEWRWNNWNIWTLDRVRKS
jgi:hypothetical protein